MVQCSYILRVNMGQFAHGGPSYHTFPSPGAPGATLPFKNAINSGSLAPSSRCLKGGAYLHTSCMDTAYVRENPPPK